MATTSLKWLALLGGVALGSATMAVAQDSGALLDALVKKGVLSDQEAEDIRADLTRDNAAAMPKFATPGGKSTKELKISGRVQVQYDNLNTDASGAGADPSSINHFFLRRVYLGAEAKVAEDFKAVFNYNFADDLFDKVYINYSTEFAGQDVSIDAGLRKVNFGLEETTSSATLKSIERSGVTRYFVESNNGRRLGAGSRRIGVFADFNSENRKADKETGLFYGLALTNPERQDANGIGNAANNNLSYWADAGYSGKFEGGKYKTGVGLGFLPDQGSVLGSQDLTVGSIYADVTFGKFNLQGEYLMAKVEGVAADNDVSGYWIQPSVMLTEKLELAARYSFVDTDGRGVRVSDGIRNAPSIGAGSVTRNELEEYYIGFNYYIAKTDVKLSAGYAFGEASGARPGSTRDEETTGFRTQLQVVF